MRNNLQQALRQLAGGWHGFCLEFHRVFGHAQSAIHHARRLLLLRSAEDDLQYYLDAHFILARLLAGGTSPQASESRQLLGRIQTLISQNEQLQNLDNQAILIMIEGVLEERLGTVAEAEERYRESHRLFRRSTADIGLDHACVLELLSNACARQGKQRRARWARQKAKAIRSKQASRMMLAHGPIY